MKWYKSDTHTKDNSTKYEPYKINSTFVGSNYNIKVNNSPGLNGTYVCEMEDTNSDAPLTGTVDLIVYDKPKLIIDLLPINISEVYMNWTLSTYNSKILRYDLFISTENGTSLLLNPFNQKIIGGQTGVKNTSYIIKNLNISTIYLIKLEVVTSFKGNSCFDIKNVTTLGEEPVFVPNISINGFSATSVTIGWTAPRDDKKKYIHYYILEAWKKNDTEPHKKAYHPRDDRNLPYMFGNLEPHTYYIFKVRKEN